MTIPANKPLIASFASAGVVTDDLLLVDWNVLELDEIDVFINSVDTPLIRGTDYDLILTPPNFQTANVKVLAPMAAALNGTDPIVIRNDLDFRQGYDASALQDLPPVGLEVVLDRLALYSRELQQQVNESLKFALGSGIVWTGSFPDPVAKKFIRFTDDGLSLIADVDGATLVAAEANADRAEAAAARYLGPSATPPTVRIDLSALQVGDLYFDTVTDKFNVWDGAAWLVGVNTAVDIVGLTAIGTLAIDDLFAAYDLSLTANRKVTIQKLWNSISTLTALGDAPAVGDKIPLRDVSASAAKHMTITNLYKAIVNLTAVTAPVLADELPIYDLSATAPRKLALTDLLKIINLLTVDATPDSAADYVATFDASTGLPKKVLLSNIGVSGALQAVTLFIAGGTWTPDANATTAFIFCTGGGGGGATVTNDSGAGGGAGSTAIHFIADTTALGGQAVAIGSGGAAEGNGGESSVAALAVAGGGLGTTDFIGGDGGVATAGTMQIDGGGGGAGSTLIIDQSGVGGASFWGGGGAGLHNDSVGKPGEADGSGGGGASAGGAARAGGAGKDGVILILEW